MASLTVRSSAEAFSTEEFGQTPCKYSFSSSFMYQDTCVAHVRSCSVLWNAVVPMCIDS